MSISNENFAVSLVPHPNPERVKALSRLGDKITQMSAHLDAGTFRLLELIGRFDEQGGWHGTGIHSCAHWLNWTCGMNLGAARERVRVARAMPDLPKIRNAFRTGKVSYSKVRAMTRVATPKNEAVLLNVALSGTASHVEKQVRLYRKVKRIEALEAENLRHMQRELSMHEEDDGSWLLKGRFTPEQGALIRKALEAAGEQLFAEQKNVDKAVSAEISDSQPLNKIIPQPVSSRRADALQRMAELFLSDRATNASSGDHYLVNIHTEINALEAEGDRAESEVENQGYVSAETSRRMSCDCAVAHWHEATTGEPLNIGRKTRTIPPAIRRALHRRDGGCRFPGCSCTRFVDAHHITHWADGGETSMKNLVLLCRRHHRLVHEEGFGVHANPENDITFTLPNGIILPPAQKPRFRGNFSAIETANQRRDLNITHQTPIPLWYGERMDPQMAVEGLLERE